MHRRLGALVLAVIASAALAACGGGSDKGSADTPACAPDAETMAAVNGAITVCGYDIRFNVRKTITTPAGPLAVTFVNKGAQPHTFEIDGQNFELKPKGKKPVTGTVTLAPGTYSFKCTIDSHAANGMQGKIVVS